MVELVWDFDNTLAYRDGMWVHTLHDVLVSRGFDMIREEALRTDPRMHGAFPWHRHREAHADYFGDRTWWGYLFSVLREVLVTAGVTETDAEDMLPQVRTAYLDLRSWHLFDDTLRNLEKARVLGHRCHLLTNHVPELRTLLDGLDITRFFDGIVISAEAGVEKPDERIFHLLFPSGTGCDRMSDKKSGSMMADAPRTIMIGDSETADVAGALACGWDAILVRRPPVRAGLKHSPDLDGIWAYIE